MGRIHSYSSSCHDVLGNTLGISVRMMDGSQAHCQIMAHPVGMPDGPQHVEIATGIAYRRDVTHRRTQSVSQTPQPHRLVARPEVGDVAAERQARPDEVVGPELVAQALYRELPRYRDNVYFEAVATQ